MHVTHASRATIMVAAFLIKHLGEPITIKDLREQVDVSEGHIRLQLEYLLDKKAQRLVDRIETMPYAWFWDPVMPRPRRDPILQSLYRQAKAAPWVEGSEIVVAELERIMSESQDE